MEIKYKIPRLEIETIVDGVITVKQSIILKCLEECDGHCTVVTHISNV
jgi:hypothetical protein